jgi:tRNA modification GTPase
MSAIAIIRMSGPRSREIARRCFVPAHVSADRCFDEAGRLRRGSFIEPATAQQIDDALLAVFRAPRSYTGEDLVEFQLHGGAGVVAACLDILLANGARLAAAGEFTKRAFLNGRLDLTQAEAVADVIAAETVAASKAAARRVSGGGGRALRVLRAELLDRLVEIEANVDYPDEVPEPDAQALVATLRAHERRLNELLRGARTARALRDGIDCVIAGPPNAGKSSLLNALLDAERAIVSELPGTTRDIIEDRVAIDGVVLRLRDTAGLRETADPIESEGVERARRAMSGAQLVITVVDASRPPTSDDRAALAVALDASQVVLFNKLDLGNAGSSELRAALAPAERREVIEGSVRWPSTVDELRAAIARLGWGAEPIPPDADFLANLRQIQALVRARECLARACDTLQQRWPLDLACADVREAIAAYGEVSGESVSEEVLDAIFSRFCVGK